MSFDRAVTVGGFPTFQMAAGSLQKPSNSSRSTTAPSASIFCAKDKLTLPDIGVPVPGGDQLAPRQGACHGQGPVGDGMAETNEAGGGAYHIDKWTPGQEVVYQRYDELALGAAAENSAGDLADGALGRQIAGLDRAR